MCVWGGGYWLFWFTCVFILKFSVVFYAFTSDLCSMIIIYSVSALFSV